VQKSARIAEMSRKVTQLLIILTRRLRSCSSPNYRFRWDNARNTAITLFKVIQGHQF